MPMLGCDLSEHNGAPDFDQLKTGVQFQISRAGFGAPPGGRVDAQWYRNMTEARRVGLLSGGYFYSYPQYNMPDEEARFDAQVYQPLTGEIAVLDFEERYGDPVGWALRWCQVYESLAGVKPGVYLNQFLVTNYNWAPVVNGNYWLWEAFWDYQPSTATGNPGAWGPKGGWLIRQYSNQGRLPGVGTVVDLNVLDGDADTWHRIGKQGPPPPPPDPCAGEHAQIAQLKAKLDQIKQLAS